VSPTPERHKQHDGFVEATRETRQGMAFRAVVQENGWGLGITLAIFDASIVFASGSLSYVLRALWLGVNALGIPLPHWRLIGILACYALLTVACNAAQNLYTEDSLRSVDTPGIRILKSFLLSSLLTIMIVYLAHESSVPRSSFVATLFFSLIGLLALRHAVQQRSYNRIEQGVGARRVLVIGAGAVGQAFQRHLLANQHLGKNFCGFVDPNPCDNRLGGLEDLPRIFREQSIDEIYFTPGIRHEKVMDIAAEAHRNSIGVMVVPELMGDLAVGASMNHVGSIPVLELNRQPIPAFGLFLKRILDLALASVFLVFTLPIMLLTVLVVKLDSKGPALYKSWRVGRSGRKFCCYKFRTMVANADESKEELRKCNERQGATFKIANDPRITPVGHFLRMYSIDELPQIFNVLTGEMSMVGPRPHPEDDFQRYDMKHLRRLDVSPGITGLWQVTARNDPSFERNVQLDLEYIESWNIFLDLRILLMTIPEVLRGTGY